MTLEVLENDYAVYKFAPEHTVNINMLSGDFFSVTKTKDELSVIARENMFNDCIKTESGWKLIKINGILDFSLIGILSGITAVLADENISVFVTSTYNTDYIMIKKENINKAIKVLLLNKYDVIA